MNFTDFILGGRYGLPFLMQVLCYLVVVAMILNKVKKNKILLLVLAMLPAISVLISFILVSKTLLMLGQEIEDISSELFYAGNSIFLAYFVAQIALIMVQFTILFYVIYKRVDT